MKMKAFFLALTGLVLCSILALAARAASSADTGAAESSLHQERLTKAADRTARAYADLGWFSGSLLLAKGGEPFFQQSYGLADIGTEAPNTPGTLFNLGSVAKHYTAVLVLQQVERGALSLDDTIDRFGVDLPKSIAEKVTVLHLLRHRAGFRDIFTPEYMADPLAYDTLDKKIRILQGRPLLFEPGSEYRYSNYGYIILGAILEKLTEESYEQLLKQNIFQPLGLKESHLHHQGGLATQSTRYSYALEGNLKQVGVIEIPGPDGGIESTTTDVLVFYHALFGSDRLLDRQGDAFRAVFDPDAEKWQAFGGGTGISSAVELNLKEDIQIVVLANSDELVAERISGRIMQVVEGDVPDAVRLPPKHFVYRQYLELGPERFQAEFRPAYEDAGYGMFVGRAINEAGMALVERQRWSQAQGLFRSLAAYFPQAPQAYDSLAFALQSEGRLEEARQTFRKALELDPEFRSDYSAVDYRREDEDGNP